MRILFMRRSGIVAVLACLMLIVCAAVFSSGGEEAVTAAAHKPIYSVDTAEKKVAVSFDAAWGADKTDGIMDILDSAGAKGTFFLVGFWAEKYPEKVKSIAQRGFEIGNHSQNHPKMTKLTAEQMRSELEQVNDRITELTGSTPTVFRPPFGDYNDAVVQTVRGVPMHCVQWSIDSLDWKGLSADAIVERTTKKVKAGDIILFHNNSDHILEALPRVLAALKKQGFSVVSVSELIYTGEYTVDNNGVQHGNN